ncbi:glycoside hydrolase family 43 protein [Parabacteroides sp. OttesenSCG-928-G06]|nr:glycoside hydrolase family 43 protein [Parabacteroides sp. OttesenSCG-928-G06]
MIMVRNLFLSFLVFFTFITCSTKQTNQFTPGELWLDNNGVHINAHGGGILYMDGTYYWYGEHKTTGEGGNVANVGVHCYSSKDLYNWKDEGIALAVMPEGSGSDIEKGCILERPKVIYNAKTGKYAMWFHLEPKGLGYGGARSGIAVSDKPTGPFTFIKSVRPNAGSWPKNYPDELKEAPIRTEGAHFTGGSVPAHPDSLNIVKRDFEGGQMARDMTLFVDEDGKAYHIYSSEENSTLHIALLTDDYLDHSGEYARFFVGRFMEAPALFKKEGTYYLMASGCTGWAPNEARSAIATNIWGPWTEIGNPCVGDDALLTFHSQSTYILPIHGKEDQFIYMGDRWTPRDAIDGRYIWLPVRFDENRFFIDWMEQWSY